MKTERRDLYENGLTIEVRDGKRTLAGYASVFYDPSQRAKTEYKLWQDMIERIAPTAFTRALKEKHDVRALFNHESGNLLGRSTAGTLRLSVDKRGLKYEIDLPDTQVGKDVAVSVERGDITGSSFAFQVTGRTIEETDNLTIRTITDVTLIDVGPVTFPAYTGTTVGVRSDCITDVENEVKEFKQQRELLKKHLEHRKQMLDLMQEKN